MAALKEQLYLLCGDYIRNREAEIKRIITEAQEAANNETKSSAGDKYETGREVMQQEIDLNKGRLNELNKLKAALEQISPTQKAEVAVPGSVVYTNNGNFYISISAGPLKVDNANFYAISAASPIGSKLAGQKAGYSFELNGKKFVIENVI
jgi:transcription elongation GreA/GreB family factor